MCVNLGREMYASGANIARRTCTTSLFSDGRATRRRSIAADGPDVLYSKRFFIQPLERHVWLIVYVYIHICIDVLSRFNEFMFAYEYYTYL